MNNKCLQQILLNQITIMATLLQALEVDETSAEALIKANFLTMYKVEELKKNGNKE